MTIPKDVRDALHLEAGDRVSFIVRDNAVVEMRAETVDIKDLVGILKVKGKRLTVEQMNEVIQRSAARR